MNTYNGERGYLQLLENTLNQGFWRDDRTGVGCYTAFAQQLRFDLHVGFPLLTTKRVSFHNVKHELLWFLSGSTNVHALHKHNVHIWDEWAGPDGQLGPVYGYQWRHWPTRFIDAPVDQISSLVNGIVDSPSSRRHVVTAWNPANVDECGLPPCHIGFQVQYVPDVHGLNLHMLMRSADLFLGVPYNIASYALLLHLIARATRMRPLELVITMVDAHVYSSHAEQVREQCARDPYRLPVFQTNPGATIPKTLFGIDPEDLWVVDYQHHPSIKAPIAI